MTKKPVKKKVAPAPAPKKAGPDRFEKMGNGVLYDTRCGLVYEALRSGVYLEDMKAQGLLEGERETMLRCCRMLEERLSRCPQVQKS